MEVFVTGATGVLGRHLVPCLRQRGYGVRRVTRRPVQPGDLVWQPERGELDPAALEAADVVVHLAGEDIAAGRWTTAKKQRIRDSRVHSTQLLSATLAGLS